jgi:hypothetical protein
VTGGFIQGVLFIGQMNEFKLHPMVLVPCKSCRFWYNECCSKVSDGQLEYFCNCASEAI